MHIKKVTRYYANCGKGFWSRGLAEDHERECEKCGEIKSSEIQEEMDFSFMCELCKAEGGGCK
jgi:hypothetical protein